MLEMAVSAVEASPLSNLRSVCGKDERVLVDPTTSPPYKWICFLTIESAKGDNYVASGFKIHLPDVNRAAVVTSAHVTYIGGAYAKKITVKFPGQMPIDVGSNDMYASPEYIASSSADYDYGLILLPGPGDCDDGFGWSAIVENTELDNRLVTNCGYPGDKPQGSMWITGGKIESYTANRIFYMNDTYGGQSGSPVYTWYNGYWTVLGVHSYGGCPNSAPRFTNEMIFRFLQRMHGLKAKTLRSVQFPDVYVRCDGSGVNKPLPSGGGTVNCQYKPPSSWESYYVYPVEMTPSLALESTCKVVLQSVQWPNVFVRMDSEGMNHPQGSGGGVVNCQFQPASSWESYVLRKESNGGYSFQSAQFAHCYIRLDGNGVDSPIGSGGGTVNCQYYDDPVQVSTWETFYMEDY